MNVILNQFRGLSITRFLEELDSHGFTWIVKRLSGNDTGLTGGHQSGLYLPRGFFERALPEVCTTETKDPEKLIQENYFPAEDFLVKEMRAVYYNSKYFPGLNLLKAYDEFRITRWGGSASPVHDPENTGSICVFGILKTQDSEIAVTWVASSLEEETTIENWLGEEVEPGRCIMAQSLQKEVDGRLIQLPEEWSHRFPGGREIFNLVTKMLPADTWKKSIDELLLRRRELEFQIFERVEILEVLPKITGGFSTVDEFVRYGHSVSNRRKSRTGTSLELNLEAIFSHKKLAFQAQTLTEDKKTPDFLFPSGKAYHSAGFPAERLNMLASKTCCKDRWRQVINEADRIETKHLFTLQEGVSGPQLLEMQHHNVELVVPTPHLTSFPKEFRQSIMTLEGFVGLIKSQQAQTENLEVWTA